MNDIIGKAKFSQLSNDLFFEFIVSDPFEVLRWTGYDDAYWWKNVSTTDQFRNRESKSGRTFRLDPDSLEVMELKPIFKSHGEGQ